MPPQTHVILREVVEVTIRGSHHAQAVHEAAARVVRGTVPGLIQHQCDEMSHPETIHRLDAVEINLGRVPLAEFEGAFARALEIALPARLGEAIRRAESATGGRRVTRAASHLELIDHFTRTGALPWWTDRTRSESVAESVRFLGREGSPGLAASLRRWAQNDVALRRIIRACADDDLHGLLLVLRPDIAGTFRALLAALRDLAEGPPFPRGLRPEPVRQQAWQGALGAAASPLAPPAREALLSEIVERIGAAFDLPARALLAALSQPAERGVVGPGSELARFLGFSRVDRLHESEEPVAGLFAAIERSLASDSDSRRAGLRHLLARVGPDAPWPVDDLQRWLRGALSTGVLPPQPLQRWLTRFGADRSPTAQPLVMAVRTALAASPPHATGDAIPLEAAGPSATISSDTDARSVDDDSLAGPSSLSRDLSTHQPLAGLLAAVESSLASGPGDRRADLHDLRAKFGSDAPWPVDDLQHWLRSMLSTGVLPPQPLQRWLARFGADRSPSAQPLVMAVRTALAASPSRSPEDAAPRDAAAPSAPDFSDADALYLDNSGLVILWPFLQTFFAHLGLLAEKRFIDDAAQHRATALLQFLLTEDRRPPPEYLLPLNKILCGLLPEILFEPGPPVTDEEQAECEQFLAAVIEQAPILHQMSLPGFRGSFLARQGQLSTRDGTWLLRVERETYDVVLDRFPWNFQWVRLPWMSAPMMVEW